jgi:hypothetical protein
MDRPPQHSISAEIAFIPESDPAWDRRYSPELDDLAAFGVPVTDHPLMAYMSGRTRFDLDAPGPIVVREDDDGQPVMGVARPRDYLRPDVQPRIFHLRRMRSIEVARCEDVGGATGEIIACQLTLQRIENAPAGYRYRAGKRVMSDEQVDALRDAIGLETIRQVGRAAMRASSQPTEQEGKR